VDSDSVRTSNACGWEGSIPRFVEETADGIVGSLKAFVRDASPEQVAAWGTHVPDLQRECKEWREKNSQVGGYSTVLEYQLPYEFRRPDVVVLANAAVVVIEMKGATGVSRAALDQAHAYARDLAAYHVECAERRVVPVLLSGGSSRPPVLRESVYVCHPSDLDALLEEVASSSPGESLSPARLLADGAYCPLPTVVAAARQLFETRELPYIKRARSATDPALSHISDIAHRAQQQASRHLVFLSGVPGSGKTLVGLQLVHARWLDDLAEPRGDGKKPTAPGVYLSGNGPLVEVLQDALKDSDGRGKTFVRPIKQYVEYYEARTSQEPPEHLIVFDEAQRAHDEERVAKVHKRAVHLSEPAHLLRFCMRVPRWNVLVALVGTGQAIHLGEERGLPLWREAVAGLERRQEWTIHCAPQNADQLRTAGVQVIEDAVLDLTQELRFHLSRDVDRLVDGLLIGAPALELKPTVDGLWAGGHRFLLTRKLDLAKGYLRERYADNPAARYGLLASAKDKRLVAHGVDNAWGAQRQMKVGQWYNAPRDAERSCCQLKQVATEFSSQGLELDCALLAWGSDYIRTDGQWSDRLSAGYRDPVVDRLALRRNVYRVLLTRGRDGTVTFVPEAAEFDETFQYLKASGFRELE